MYYDTRPYCIPIHVYISNYGCVAYMNGRMVRIHAVYIWIDENIYVYLHCIRGGLDILHINQYIYIVQPRKWNTVGMVQLI